MAVFIHHGRGIGRATGLLGKQVGKRLAQVNLDVLAGSNLDDALSLIVTDDADAVDGLIEAGHHLLHGGLDGIGHHAQGLAAVHGQARLHAYIVILVAPSSVACHLGAHNKDVRQHIIEHVATVLLHKRAMLVAKVVFLLPSRQSGEIERDAWLHAQVTAEV